MKSNTQDLAISFEQLSYTPLIGYTIVRISDLTSNSEIQVVLYPTHNPKDRINKELKELGWEKYSLLIEHQYLTKSQALVLKSVSKFNLKAGQQRKDLVMKRYPRNPFVAACAEGVLDLNLYWTTCLDLAWRKYSIFFDRYGTTIKAPTPCNSNPKFNPQRNTEVAEKYKEFCKPFWHQIDIWEKARSSAPCQFSNGNSGLVNISILSVKEDYAKVQEEYLFLCLLDLYNVKATRVKDSSEVGQADYTQENYFKILNSDYHNPYYGVNDSIIS